MDDFLGAAQLSVLGGLAHGNKGGALVSFAQYSETFGFDMKLVKAVDKNEIIRIVFNLFEDLLKKAQVRDKKFGVEGMF
jgi:hypothetical protein